MKFFKLFSVEDGFTIVYRRSLTPHQRVVVVEWFGAMLPHYIFYLITIVGFIFSADGKVIHLLNALLALIQLSVFSAWQN